MKYLANTSTLLRRLFLALLLFSGLFTLNSCQDDPELPADSPVLVNRWIKEIMDEVYYWLDDMKKPIAESSDPEDYFESLLFRPTDRFSEIFPDYQELINGLQGVSKEAGYEIGLVQESGTQNVLAFVLYIKKGSPAEAQGLRRGDIITQINGTTMTTSNFRDVIARRSDNHSITYFRYFPESDQYQQQPTMNLQTVELAENPNFLDTIYTVNNQKIGYVVYHFFAPGVDGDRRYDDQMDAIFGKFKNAGINHLIVDFRYNGGGFVNSAVNLASLIGPGVTSNDVFSKTKYNSFIMGFEQFRNVQTKFLDKAQNLGPTLTGNRLYVITSSRTASASELIINGLKPYMDVFLVGGKTVGKNVGSIPFEDEDNPANKYGLLPIVTMSFNRDDRSDYTNGFDPNIAISEFSQRNLLPLGDTQEYMLRTTLNQILGLPQGRVALMDRKEIGSSLNAQVRFGRMIEDKIK